MGVNNHWTLQTSTNLSQNGEAYLEVLAHQVSEGYESKIQL